jgi:hypothetical protein
MSELERENAGWSDVKTATKWFLVVLPAQRKGLIAADPKGNVQINF